MQLLFLSLGKLMHLERFIGLTPLFCDHFLHFLNAVTLEKKIRHTHTQKKKTFFPTHDFNFQQGGGGEGKNSLTLMSRPIKLN